MEWLPFGTFTCNMLACAVDFALLALDITSPLNTRQNATVAAIKGGGMGSLSTVSTWAAEVRSTAFILCWSHCLTGMLLVLFHLHSHGLLSTSLLTPLGFTLATTNALTVVGGRVS